MARVPKEIQELADKMGGEVVAYSHEELYEVVKHVFQEEFDELKGKLHAVKVEAMVALHRLGGTMQMTQEEVSHVMTDYTLEHRLDTAAQMIQVYLRLKEKQ